ncbi:hypothetical protein [Niabella hibiscisoli]|uniref:hypothetical protein n=1 Tax=Niabella hibiscisoli TaxID=1825928 RepID=UPI001F0CF97D|nr:hypothetical protein [Niabella hibiscisoli]MCH5715608.1 hypothetical protein [Niabella hibiscisoli]
MQEPVKENGWDIISGKANYTDGEQKGMVTLLTATGGGQMVSVVLIANSDTYQGDLLSLIQSLEITAASSKHTIAISNATTSAGSNGSIVGLWTDYFNETSGYVNGVPQYSAGYFRKEYVFYADGRYLFRQKNWSVYAKDILFNYETGTYKVQGKKLTITPATGKGGWWSKAPGGSTRGWGSKVKASDRKLQTVTYDVNWETYNGADHPFLVLHSPNPTEREGNNENYQSKFRSKPLNETMIDNPPGINTGF